MILDFPVLLTAHGPTRTKKHCYTLNHTFGKLYVRVKNTSPRQSEKHVTTSQLNRKYSGMFVGRGIRVALPKYILFCGEFTPTNCAPYFRVSEQRYGCQCLGFIMFNVRTDVEARDCTRGLYEHLQRLCINPFTAPASQNFLAETCTQACKQYIFPSYNTSIFDTV